jgi:hypothetical protein
MLDHGRLACTVAQVVRYNDFFSKAADALFDQVRPFSLRTVG